jgi:hypothetical protein
MRRLPVLFLPFILPFSLLAQFTTGNLEGRVVDTTGAAIVGVNVQASSEALQGIRGCNTDDAGHFRLPALPPAYYSVKFTHVTTQPLTLENIRIFLGRTTNAGEIVLRERRIELEGVLVTAARPLIDPRSTVTGANLTDTKFNLLPINRSYVTMIQLAPQSSPSFYDDGTNIAGATGIENRYFIDGADVTDVFRGISGTQLPYNFIREVEVRSGAYEAEYSSSLGGIVNAITYSGGNEMHGQVFGFFTNNRFSGSPRFSVGKPPSGSFSEYDIGVSLGGPILRDKLWYYVAYNPKFQSEDVEVPGQPNQNDHSTTHMFASKLSWNLNESNLFTLSVAGDPTVRRGVGVDFRYGGAMNPLKVLDLNCYLSNIRTGSTNIVMTGTHTLGANTLLESSLSYVSRSAGYDPVGYSEPYFFVDQFSNVQSGTYQRSLDRTATIHAGIRAIVTLDAHTLKAGIEYSELSHHSEDMWKWLWTFSENYFEYQFVNWAGETSSRNPSVFVQDSWLISERLTVNGGIRWDPQWLIASDGTTGQKILGTVAPRLGIIYQPGKIGSDRLVASVGRFYQPLSLYLSSQMHLISAYVRPVGYDHDPRIDTSGGNVYGDFQGHMTNVRDLSGQYYDEITLGYESEMVSGLKAGARLIYRNLGQAVNTGYDYTRGLSVYGNPGSAPLEMYPKAKREYKAMELTLERSDPTGLSFQASYVLSSNYGNYEGLADVTFTALHGAQELSPNGATVYVNPVMLNNNLGLLPDDRTHQFKFFSSYPITPGFTIGVSGYWTSGTPLNELGSSTPSTGLWPIFLKPRGSLGRTPSIWDANLRLVYDLGGMIQTTFHPRLILDVLHLFGQKTGVYYDETHYFYADDSGNQLGPNPNYGLPIAFQPPMSARLGMEVIF